MKLENFTSNLKCWLLQTAANFQTGISLKILSFKPKGGREMREGKDLMLALEVGYVLKSSFLRTTL